MARFRPTLVGAGGEAGLDEFGVGGKPLTHMLDQHASNFTRPRLRVESERNTAHRIGGVLGVTSRPPLGLPSQNPAGWPLRGFPIWSRVYAGVLGFPGQVLQTGLHTP